MATAAARNARLDALVQAVTEWGDRRQKEITDRVATSKRILQGRTGGERLAQTSVSATSAFVVDSIDDFLLT